MQHLLSIFAYASVISRGLLLALQCLLVGGVAFRLTVIYPVLRGRSPELEIVEGRVNRVLFWMAIATAVVESLWTTVNTLILMSTAELRFREVVGAQFFVAAICIILGALALATLIRSGVAIRMLLPFCILILAASVATGHAWSRLDHRFALSALSFLHQLAAGIWVGGMPFLLLTVGTCRDVDSTNRIARRFSQVAIIGVVLVLLGGMGLAISYIDAPNAAYGTTYGVMVLSKVALFLVLLVIGAFNKSIVGRLDFHSSSLLSLLRRNLEAEIGIGFTVVLAAASLTAQPPAIDLTADRLNLQDLYQQFVPRLPRFISPEVKQLSTPTRQLLKREAEKQGMPSSYAPGLPPSRPETPAGKAWSEYNHNWAGLIVLTMGLLAVFSRFRFMKWARHWPLMFIALAIFIFLRADPENWPLGPNGFWESCLESDVLQHRFFALLIIAFAIFEWRVQTDRIRFQAGKYVFPAICAIGGALLFTHSHSLGNIKQETLIEWTHLPLAFIAVIAGWSRWAEIRSAKPNKRLGWLWSSCFVMIGTVLLLYREL